MPVLVDDGSDDVGVVETPTPARAGTVTDVAAMTAGGTPMWLLLSEGGQVGRWHVESDDYQRLAVASVPPEAERDRWADRVPRPRLHASADGRFAAVVNDYGRLGQVLDLRTGEVTMTLDNTGDEEETVPFSLAFLEHAGRTVVVHRTAWNRLDASVAATGEPLTARPGDPSDHFHGALYVSPDGRRILDDGWIWHPVGVVTVSGVQRWLARDEDPALHVCSRDYYWDHAMTWIDETRVAVEGIGDDDNRMRPGARVFDTGRTAVTAPFPAPHAVEVATIPGPAGRFFSDGAVLYSADGDGLHSWDPAGGERLGTVPGFTPTHHHRPAGRFLELRDGSVRIRA
ncbi:hypothetical protein OHA72_54425 [Dactylosporangium sp. NBC_01737]|uniref:hypothetical protein n=1 Tax=Dactylosporangium sp. NBC_01737 TaxID=2975959 RepID=UPI002E165133|nr:hypothetical protein OHA72_54425 [Dactylosporangium sp. NBC_01737]